MPMRRSGLRFMAAERIGMKVAAVFVARSRVQKMLQEEVRRLEGRDADGREG